MAPYTSTFWTENEQNRALVEGWGVFFDADKAYIQRWDELSRFDGDDEAAKYVAEQAAAGSIHAKRALQAVEFENKPELIPETKLMDVTDLGLPWTVIPEYRIGQPLLEENIYGHSLRNTAGVVMAVCNSKATALKLMRAINEAGNQDTITMSMATFKQQMDIRRAMQLKLKAYQDQLGAAPEPLIKEG